MSRNPMDAAAAAAAATAAALDTDDTEEGVRLDVWWFDVPVVLPVGVSCWTWS